MWLFPAHLGGRNCPGARPARGPSFPGSSALPKRPQDVCSRLPASSGRVEAQGSAPRWGSGWPPLPTAGTARTPRRCQPCQGLCPRLGSILPAGVLGCWSRLGGTAPPAQRGTGHPRCQPWVRGSVVLGQEGWVRVASPPWGCGDSQMWGYSPPLPCLGVPEGPGGCRAGAQLGASVGCSSCLLRSGAFYKTKGNKIEKEKKKTYIKKKKK